MPCLFNTLGVLALQRSHSWGGDGTFLWGMFVLWSPNRERFLLRHVPRWAKVSSYLLVLSLLFFLRHNVNVWFCFPSNAIKLKLIENALLVVTGYDIVFLACFLFLEEYPALSLGTWRLCVRLWWKKSSRLRGLKSPRRRCWRCLRWEQIFFFLITHTFLFRSSRIKTQHRANQSFSSVLDEL